MLKYQLSGTDAQGQRNTITIHAADSQDAFTRMEAQGYSDIVLHTDDVAAAITQMMPQELDECEASDFVTAADEVEFRFLSNWGFFFHLTRKLYVQWWWTSLICVAILGNKLISDRPFSIWDTIWVVLLLLPLALGVHSAVFSKTRKYDQMLEALHWGRWQEVHRLAPALRGHIPDLELDIRIATALAGQGKLSEGLRMLAPYAELADVPKWMYYARLTEVYLAAQQPEEALKCQEQSYAIAPDNSTVALDLAMGLLKNQVDTPRAQKLIEDVESQHLSDVVQIFVGLAKSLLYLNQGQYREAAAGFRKGEDDLLPLAVGSAPVRSAVDMSRAFRAIAMAHQGLTADAEKLFTTVRSRWEALPGNRLVERFDRAMGR